VVQEVPERENLIVFVGVCNINPIVTRTVPTLDLKVYTEVPVIVCAKHFSF
jgi:hypothetical protein